MRLRLGMLKPWLTLVKGSNVLHNTGFFFKTQPFVSEYKFERETSESRANKNIHGHHIFMDIKRRTKDSRGEKLLNRASVEKLGVAESGNWFQAGTMSNPLSANFQRKCPKMRPL